jgi:IS4 transposase
MDQKTYAALPETMTVREVRVRVGRRGLRTRDFVVVTSLLDAEEGPKEDLAELYRARWRAESDLRSLKGNHADGCAPRQNA